MSGGLFGFGVFEQFRARTEQFGRVAREERQHRKKMAEAKRKQQRKAEIQRMLEEMGYETKKERKSGHTDGSGLIFEGREDEKNKSPLVKFADDRLDQLATMLPPPHDEED